MNFYISQIKLWFRNETKPRALEFHQDKVNVITGASSTGKSSILKILDYCFLQDPCNIVQDIINESVSWYGVQFYVESKAYSIMRKAPTIERSEMIVIFREGESLPEGTPVALDSDQRSNVLIKLNELFKIPVKVKLESKVKLNFRHFLLFNYLTEDIIATENTYQDLRFFRDREYDKILDDIFKLVIGNNERKVRELDEQIKKAQSEYDKTLEAQKKEVQSIESYNNRKKNYIQELASLNLCDSTDIDGDPNDWLCVLSEVTKNYKIQFKNVRNDKRRGELEQEIEELKETIDYYTSLEREYKTYKKRLARQKDSLQPIEFIENHMNDIFHYYETGILLNKLKSAWLLLKESYTPEVTLPSDFEIRKNQLVTELSKKQEELNKLNPIMNQHPSVQWLRQVILLAEKIEKDLKKVPSLSIKDEEVFGLKEKLINLQEIHKRIIARNDNSLGELNAQINKYFKYQNSMSDSYRDCTPVYSTKVQSLMLDRPNTDYPISNVGSKSNYMFLHLCYFLGLHNLMADRQETPVLPFLFIDQPSIPYYADRTSDADIDGGDKEKLIDAFKLIQKFMETIIGLKKHFQIIMVEHADPVYWNNLINFDTIEIFSKHKGLIPEESISK